MYHTVCVAGTFDGLHRGHETLLSTAFAQGDEVLIGLTSDEFVLKFKKKRNSFVFRKKILEQWLTEHDVIDRATIVSIDDPIGPAGTADIDALIVTKQNYHVGEEINILRNKNGKSEMMLITVPLVNAEDMRVISSTRVRRGEIDRDGRLIMPDSMREELATPLGKIIELTHIQKEKFIISVGDETSKNVLEAGVVPRIMVIDHKVSRKSYDDHNFLLSGTGAYTIHVQSGPGYISREAIQKISECMRHTPCILDVDGEEDLLVLPVIVEAPIDSVVYYGQPGKGVVEVSVTEGTKRIARTLLARFFLDS